MREKTFKVVVFYIKVNKGNWTRLLVAMFFILAFLDGHSAIFSTKLFSILMSGFRGEDF